MRVKNSTQRFQAFGQDLQESFGGDSRGRTREVLKNLLESDAEQQMADHLGRLKKSIPERGTSVAGYTRRGIYWRKCGGGRKGR